MKIGYFISVALFACFAAYMYNGCKPAWQFDHLEQNAKKVITARELQSWATNLLARYPVETNFSASELGANFPHQLRTLAPRLGPHIFVHVYDDTNQPPYVQVYWGSGFLAGPASLLAQQTTWRIPEVSMLGNLECTSIADD